MVWLKAEFTVEPFEDGAPGPHVVTAISAVRDSGLEPNVGPFATAVDGDPAAVTRAVQAAMEAAFAHGATRVSVTVERDGA